ncbi:uncharacterized protein LOC103507216 isoform X2 [Diaphorina citri]|uniref:Uncharacterized protein LOC103507216 isoform X1 n=1 Tax=Diaphorina citri TaxID=121845 RepID=A0A1S3CXN7_DIACI|nr:uncharacterized protein LOC103507216 isoform X1 [Diaphorina citri]XP_017298716.1 uncharacterized protein LOC103507216 isoform X2 [Diaphorina citri]
MSKPIKRRKRMNPASLQELCFHNAVVNLIGQNGAQVKKIVHEKYAGNLVKRKKFVSNADYFIRIVSAWRQELTSKIMCDIKASNLPPVFANALSEKCSHFLIIAFKWIRDKWQECPDVVDINLFIFQFHLLHWNLDGTLNEKNTYINHLCFVLENDEAVIETIKTRYSTSYSSILKLIILQFKIRIHEHSNKLQFLLKKR